MGEYLGCIFAELQLAFCKKLQKSSNNEQVYLQLKNMKQEKNERMEVYHERLLKLANSLQHKTINSFSTIVLRSELQPYMSVTIIDMKKKTLQQHKETTLVCEEGISEVEAISNLLVLQSSKIILAQKPQTFLEKTRMY